MKYGVNTSCCLLLLMIIVLYLISFALLLMILPLSLKTQLAPDSCTAKNLWGMVKSGINFIGGFAKL